MKRGNKQNKAMMAHQSRVPESQKWIKLTPQGDDEGDEVTCAPARRGRLSAPQLQAELGCDA